MKWPLPIFLAIVTLGPVDCSSRFLIGGLLLMQFGLPALSSHVLFSNLLSPPRCDQGSYMHLRWRVYLLHDYIYRMPLDRLFLPLSLPQACDKYVPRCSGLSQCNIH